MDWARKFGVFTAASLIGVEKRLTEIADAAEACDANKKSDHGRAIV